MAIVMLDYENIQQSRGMQGFYHLGARDKLYLFYSSSCPNIRQEYIDHIHRIGFEFYIIKLKQPRKNALDFYIAAQAGILTERGEKQIAIISGDKGLQSIADFFDILDDPSVKVVVEPSIDQGLMALTDPEDVDRRKLIEKATKNVSIEAEQVRIEERQRLRNLIEETFLGTSQEMKIGSIVHFVEQSRTYSAKKRYTQSLHRFGRDEGLIIYKKLKDCI